MSERKWTPGPWTVGWSNDTGDNDDYYVEWITAGPADLKDGNAENDAPLIAAAPDLYEALEQALNDVDGAAPGACDGLMLNWVSMARDAIKKANGG